MAAKFPTRIRAYSSRSSKHAPFDTTRHPARKRGHRRPRRDLQAQCAVSAWRLSLRAARTIRPISDAISKATRSSSASSGLGSSRRPHATAPARSSGRSSISGVCPGRSVRSASSVLPALGRRQVATGRAKQLPDRRRLFSAGAATCAKDESRTHAVAGGFRACRGLDARRVQRVCAGPNET